jgi:hypothetical protein
MPVLGLIAVRRLCATSRGAEHCAYDCQRVGYSHAFLTRPAVSALRSALGSEDDT